MIDIATNIAAVGKREGKRDAQLGAFLAAVSKIVLAKSRELARLRAENERLRAALTAERQAIADKAREWAALYQPGSDGCNTFVLLAEWIEAREHRIDEQNAQEGK